MIDRQALDDGRAYSFASLAAPPVPEGAAVEDTARDFIGVAWPLPERSVAQLVRDASDWASHPLTFEAMLRDAVIGASVLALRLGAIGDGPTLASRFPSPDGREFDPTAPPDDATEDQVEARKALAFCRWMDDGLKTPITQVAFQLSQCVVFGSKLCEKEFGDRVDDDGLTRLVPIDLRAKSWRQWHFAADRYNRVTGILCPDPEKPGETLKVDPAKFVWATYLAESDDPGGQSVMPCLLPWWKLKHQVPGNAGKFVRLFSLPIPVVIAAQLAAAVRGTDGKTADPKTEYVTTISALMAGSGVMLPNGSDLKLLESAENADPFVKVVDLCDRQMVHGITGSARTSLEAQHGSKADAESAQDSGFDLMKILVRGAVTRALTEHHYYDALARNFGEEWATRYTPVVSFGSTVAQDIAKVSSALATLANAGFILDSQKQSALRMLMGWDLPEPASDDPGTRGEAAFDDDDDQGGER